MAKKDPTDMPVEERLKTLYQLQTTLSGNRGTLYSY